MNSFDKELLKLEGYTDVEEFESTSPMKFETYSKIVKYNILRNKDYLLEKLIEEASEVIQAAQKIKLFTEEHSYDDKSNIEHLSDEIKDFLCVLDLYANVQHNIPVNVDNDYWKYKRDRIAYYGLFAQQNKKLLNG